jgi:hypothetical protein
MIAPGASRADFELPATRQLVDGHMIAIRGLGPHPTHVLRIAGRLRDTGGSDKSPNLEKLKEHTFN